MRWHPCRRERLLEAKGNTPRNRPSGRTPVIAPIGLGALTNGGTHKPPHMDVVRWARRHGRLPPTGLGGWSGGDDIARSQCTPSPGEPLTTWTVRLTSPAGPWLRGPCATSRPHPPQGRPSARLRRRRTGACRGRAALGPRRAGSSARSCARARCEVRWLPAPPGQTWPRPTLLGNSKTCAKAILHPTFGGQRN
jgi:hypothetical protein